jgi:hypothetical protein
MFPCGQAIIDRDRAGGICGKVRIGISRSLWPRLVYIPHTAANNTYDKQSMVCGGPVSHRQKTAFQTVPRGVEFQTFAGGKS